MTRRWRHTWCSRCRKRFASLNAVESQRGGSIPSPKEVDNLDSRIVLRAMALARLHAHQPPHVQLGRHDILYGSVTADLTSWPTALMYLLAPHASLRISLPPRRRPFPLSPRPQTARPHAPGPRIKKMQAFLALAAPHRGRRPCRTTTPIRTTTTGSTTTTRRASLKSSWPAHAELQAARGRAPTISIRFNADLRVLLRGGGVHRVAELRIQKKVEDASACARAGARSSRVSARRRGYTAVHCRG
ncbi:hypothetical protein DFH06DRAFT_560862 [Mycena polygramma]|nr:hypothetical protein DFH06DRAFT_560862 [Mycena polygramma]